MNNNLDNKIKKELEENLKVPDIVKARMRESFEEVEKLEEKMLKQSKINFNKILTLVASFVMVAFLAGNGVAYAKGEPNIYSWVLERIGIQKEYEENASSINAVAESNGTKITIVDAALDDEFLAIRYKIESSVEFQDMIYLGIDSKLEEDEPDSVLINPKNNSTVLNHFMIDSDINHNTHRYFYKVSANEYELYEIYLLKELKDIDCVQIKMNFKNIYDNNTKYAASYDIGEASVKGNWVFDIIVNKNNENELFKYVLNRNIIIPKEITGCDTNQEFKLVSVKQNNIVTIIEVEDNGLYRNDEMVYLCLSVEVIDENGNVLLERGKQFTMNGNIYLKKIDLKQKLTINFYDSTKEKLSSNGYVGSGENIEGIIDSFTFNINQ